MIINKFNSVLARKLLQGSLLLSIGNFVSRLLMFIALFWLARILSKSEYGKFSVLKSTIDSFLIFATAGLSFAATNFTAKFIHGNTVERVSKIITSIFQLAFTLGFIIATVVVIFSKELSENAFGNDNLQTSLVIVAFTIFFTSVNSIQIGVLVGLEAFKSNMIVNLVQGVSILIFIPTGAYIANYHGAVIGVLLSMLMTILMSFIFIRQRFKENGIKLCFFKKNNTLNLVINYTLPLFFSSLLTTPVLWILNSIIAKTQNGFEQIGVYNAVYLLPGVLLTINKILVNVLTPFLLSTSKLSLKQDFITQIFGWIICIYMSTFLVAYPEFTSQILGDKYKTQDINLILSLILGTVLIIAHRQGIAINLLKKNKTNYSLYSMFQWAISTILIFHLLDFPGALKLSLSIYLGYLLNTILFVPFFVKKKIANSQIYFNRFHLLLFVFANIILFINVLIPVNIYYRSLILFIEWSVITLTTIKYYYHVIPQTLLEN